MSGSSILLPLSKEQLFHRIPSTGYNAGDGSVRNMLYWEGSRSFPPPLLSFSFSGEGSKAVDLKETPAMPDKELLVERVEEIRSGPPQDQGEHPVQRSTGAALLKHAGAWQGDDLKERLREVYETRGKAVF